MLKVSNLTVKYDTLPVLTDVSLEVRPGEIIALVGGNGAGKTSVAKAIVGLIKPTYGHIEIFSSEVVRNLIGKPGWAIARMGILYVPEAKAVFEHLSVEENLRVVFTSVRMNRSARKQRIEQIYSDFPLLQERSGQLAGTLSGGQKKVLAIARALMFMNSLDLSSNGFEHFRLLILDEPTHGLHPANINIIGGLLRQLNTQGISILIVEQMATFALKISNRGYLMRQGSIVAEGDSEDLLRNPELTDLYLGTIRTT